ncbi:MAG: DUF4270 family protein [Owenweeksia sp.]|nr:DUF4270 family protein [Owenweeksia sp.]
MKSLKRAILLMAPFVLLACEKPNEELGIGQVTGGLAGLGDTTLEVLSYTQKLDSTLVALSYEDQKLVGGYFGNRMVGALVDGHFGRSESAVVAQMRLDGVNVDFGTNPVIDSVSLFMRYNGAYGDTSGTHEC